MVFSFLYRAVRALLGALVRSRRGLRGNDIELLVLRHELEILGRQVARPKLKPADRALLAAAARHLPRSSRGVLLVTPRTLLRWHQTLVRRRWRQPTGRRGRPRLPAEVRQPVLRLAGRIHVGPSADLRRAREAPRPRVADKHPAPALPGATGAGAEARGAKLARIRARSGGEHRGLRLLHRRQHLPSPLLRAPRHHAREPAHPAGRLHGQPDRRLGNPAGTQSRPRLLCAVRPLPDSRPRQHVQRPLRRGISQRRHPDRDDPVRAPQANAIAERFVRTVRAECLDWLLILNRRHLEPVLRVYVDHYNKHRPHRALKLRPPQPDEPPLTPTTREIHRHDGSAA
jgi:putative transposase